MKRTIKYDIVVVGLGGQGVLTLCDRIAAASMHGEIPVSYYPTKGMAQRGGFVKCQVRLLRENSGPHIPERGADLIIALERSEAFNTIPFIKAGGEFLLYDDLWVPITVQLRKEAYPSRDMVRETVAKSGITFHYLSPKDLPEFERRPVPANIFVLGATVAHSKLGRVISPSHFLSTLEERWPQKKEMNRFAFYSGMEARLSS